MKRVNFIQITALALSFVYHTAAFSADVNIAKYRVVTHSSSHDVNQCGHLVVDGCPQSYWEAFYRDKDQWLLIDLAEPQYTSQITIDWGENYGVDYSVTVVQTKDSESHTIYETTQGEGGHQTISFEKREVQFVRININKNLESIRGCTIGEVAVMGDDQNRFVASQVNNISSDDLSLDGQGWRVQSAAFVEDEASDISKVGYNDKEWIPATVPGTVLADYYNFGALPDPLFGDNMHQISDSFFSGNDFWYRTTISLPQSVDGKRLYLNFAGVNYRSQIYFNGVRIGAIDGAFHRGEFEITDLVNPSGDNVVAVLVGNNDNWVSGSFKVIKKTLGCATTNGDMLGLDGPTSLAAAGWNWLPIIKGRNNGIWNSVTLVARNDVEIIDPWVETDLMLPDTTRANLTIRAGVKNNSSKGVEGVVRAKFNKTTIELPITLSANEERQIILTKEDFKELSIKNPKLWWPNGYGEQNLINMNLEFVVGDKLSDTKSFDFGVREFDYVVENDILFIYCNGYRIQLKGGNWGLPEAMMRLDREDYDLRVMLHKEANFNMIRNWLGMTNREEFYDACDKYGILIFDDFWLANPANGPAASDLDLFMANAQDKIKWVRKHPSLVLYCGRNEGLPPVKFDFAMRRDCEALDGTRHYVANSADKPLSGFGPYDVREPAWYFENRGATFHSEVGIIAIPEVESFRKMMPEENLWPINNMWAIRDYQAPRSFRYTTMLDGRYGESNSIEEYSRRAQLQNYETSKALFECLQSRQGSGMLLWMSQSAWPSLICQLYDHYLEYTASYFAVKRACSPIHILYDSAHGKVKVANNTRSDIKGVKATATIYDKKGSVVWTTSQTADIAVATTEALIDLKHTAAEHVQYLKLELTQKGKTISENFYWLENSAGNCLDLNDLKEADVSMSIKERRVDGRCVAEVTLTNNSDEVSLLNKLRLKDKESGESILPIIYSDSYVSLMPGQSCTLTLHVDQSIIEGRDVEIHLEGWNTKHIVEAIF
ncbi:MAG: discoidin domain-containing protein [Rikenellaceae bacterium]